MRFLYSFFALPIYNAGLLLASCFSSKARQWVEGREGQMQQMRKVAKPNQAIAWFHCASLGEFEQGRPLIEEFRKEFSGYRILLTFFSPSGYLVRKDYQGADYIFYLPLDTPANVRQFLDIWNPSLAVFVKYDFWFNYIFQLHQRNIPVIVVSAIFRPEQHFFRYFGGWFRKQLKNISWFFVQNSASLQLLKEHGIQNVSVSGDTRFDRVLKIRNSPGNFPILEEFTTGQKVIIAGSTWPKDEQMLLRIINNGPSHLKFIIAPHEIHPEQINQLKESINGHVALYSGITASIPADTKAVIIDSIGMLSHLYQYGTMAYIGGGFGRGIHNILEAATFGLPVFFGPEYKKFAEAIDLTSAGGAFPVTEENELQKKMEAMLNDKSLLEAASSACRGYVEIKTGASATIINYLKKSFN